MSRIFISILLTTLVLSCTNSKKNQVAPQLVGGPCEGCEAIFEYDDKNLYAVDTLPDFNDEGSQIKITGTVYHSDAMTPAEDVILYIYHTDQAGIYATKGNERGWAKRHGYIRGWIKTNSMGQYTFYTLKPGVYPSLSEPAHIHLTVLEPNGKYYWIGSYFFEGDSLLTYSEITRDSARGGSSGILRMWENGGILLGTRDIILGENIPGYNF